MGLTEIAVGDYVKFTRIIEGAKRSNIKDASGKQHGGVTEPERLVEQPGSGQVLRLNRAPKHIGDEKLRVGRVDAGPVLGTVTAILDDAVLIGVQLAIDTQVEAFSGSISMYDTQGSGA